MLWNMGIYVSRKQKHPGQQFAFGQWVLVDGTVKGQVLSYNSGTYTVDTDGLWQYAHEGRLTKDKEK